jgi:hypothetical protein
MVDSDNILVYSLVCLVHLIPSNGGINLAGISLQEFTKLHSLFHGLMEVLVQRDSFHSFLDSSLSDYNLAPPTAVIINWSLYESHLERQGLKSPNYSAVEDDFVKIRLSRDVFSVREDSIRWNLSPSL